MKYRKLMTCICIVSIGLAACGKEVIPNFREAEAPTVFTAEPFENVDPMQERLEARCKEITDIYRPLYETMEGMTPTQWKNC